MGRIDRWKSIAQSVEPGAGIKPGRPCAARWGTLRRAWLSSIASGTLRQPSIVVRRRTEPGALHGSDLSSSAGMRRIRATVTARFHYQRWPGPRTAVLSRVGIAPAGLRTWDRENTQAYRASGFGRPSLRCSMGRGCGLTHAVSRRPRRSVRRHFPSRRRCRIRIEPGALPGSAHEAALRCGDGHGNGPLTGCPPTPPLERARGMTAMVDAAHPRSRVIWRPSQRCLMGASGAWRVRRAIAVAETERPVLGPFNWPGGNE
jgi:hypothetical protein